MDRMTLTPLGVTFTDYLLTTVGASAFQLPHDFFSRQDLQIRTAAGGGGVLLAENTDYTLTNEDTYLSGIMTLAVGAGRNVMRNITIITVGYQTGNLYFSGKYVADALDFGDYSLTIASSSSNHALANDDIPTIINHTVGGAERTETLGQLQFNLGRRVEIWNIDGTAEVKIAFNGTEKAKYKGASYSNLWVGLQGQCVVLQAKADGWYIIGGIVQAVALEPDVGGGLHLVKDSNRTTTPTVNTSTNTAGTWSAAVTMTGIPTGVRKASALIYLAKAAVQAYLAIEAATGYTLSNITTGTNKYLYPIYRCDPIGQDTYQMAEIHLDPSGQYKWCTSDSNSTVVIGSAVDYVLGPA